MERMSGVAMNPNLKDGELMLYTRIGATYSANDVVLFKHDGYTGVSRVIATEHQTVDLNEEGYITVNGAVESSDIVYDLSDSHIASSGIFPYVVPTGCYFVLNDNYEYTEDSRTFGAVDSKAIFGRVVTTLKVRDI
jgi:signal peptidase I